MGKSNRRRLLMAQFWLTCLRPEPCLGDWLVLVCRLAFPALNPRAVAREILPTAFDDPDKYVTVFS